MAAFDQADYFLIPLLDGTHGVGQIIEMPVGDETAPFVGLTARIAAPGDTITPLVTNDYIALLRIDPSAIAGDLWPKAGFDQIPRFQPRFNFTAIRALGWTAYPIHDPAVIEAFVSAWHGLYPWDAFGDLFEQIKRAHLDSPGAAP